MIGSVPSASKTSQSLAYHSGSGDPSGYNLRILRGTSHSIASVNPAGVPSQPATITLDRFQRALLPYIPSGSGSNVYNPATMGAQLPPPVVPSAGPSVMIAGFDVQTLGIVLVLAVVAYFVFK